MAKHFTALLLIAVTLMAYYPALNGTPLWDDDQYHLRIHDFTGVSGLERIWFEPGVLKQYYPAAYTVFWAEYGLWGDSPFAHHVINVLLHALGALLLFLILKRLDIPGALLAALLFALHPVQVESAAWISELKNTLSGAFFLASSLLYLRFDETRRRMPYGLALGGFVLALLSKNVVATLPAALLVVLWWKRGKLSLKNDVVPLLPFFALSAVFSVLSVSMEQNVVGAAGDSYNFSLIERGLIAGRAFWFYLGKLVWPNPLVFIYPRWQISGSVWWQYLFPLAALGLVVGLWTLRKRTRAPIAAALLFGGILFPALGFFNVYPFKFSFVADHFQYLACIAPLTLAAAAIAVFFSGMQKPIGAVLAIVLFGLTWQQAGMYTDIKTLWQTTIDRNPDAAMAHYNLGLIVLLEGRTEEAIRRFTKALALEPDNEQAHNNLADALVRSGRKEEAVDHFRRASQLAPSIGRYHANLANALVAIGKDHDAAVEYETALNLVPSDTSIQNNYAWILATSADKSARDGKKAVALAEKAVHAGGESNPILQSTLAAAYAESGRFEDAVTAGEKSVALAKSANNAAVFDWNSKLLELYRHRQAYPFQ